MVLAEARYAAGHRRTCRPWIPEPGMWAQSDGGTAPRSLRRVRGCKNVAKVVDALRRHVSRVADAPFRTIG